MKTISRKPVNVLLIDDDPGFCIEFKGEAAHNRIIINYKHNLREGIELLKNSTKHEFVILDARCFMDNDEADVSKNFAIRAKDEIDKLSREQGRSIPYCINTGFSEYKEILEGSVRVFDKGVQDEELFQFIFQTIEGLPKAKVQAAFPEVFDFVDNYFDETGNTQTLINLLSKDNYLSNRIEDRISNLAMLRRVSEHVMDIIFVNYLHSNPGVSTNRGRRSLDIIKYMFANYEPLTPSSVAQCIKNIYYTSSAYGNHSPEKFTAGDYIPSRYLVASLTYGLLETIIWSNNLLNR